MEFLLNLLQGHSTAWWWCSALLTPSLLALFPVSCPQKAGRS